jgi:hypothetical protein
MLNPKLAAIDNPIASWTYVVSICYCGGSFTDGHFPIGKVLRLADASDAIGQALIDEGLWHVADHDCPNCPQPKPGTAVVHDYLRHQRSAAEASDLTSKRREAGRRGAQKRWSQVRGAEADGNAVASAMANAKQVPWQMDGKAIAEERRGEENKKTSSSSQPPGGGKQDEQPPRDDVERLCNRLADRVEENGSKRPTIGKTWRTACRRMLDIDKRTEAQVAKAIDWCQDDEFWRGNILSMSALRKYYERLRLKAQAEARRASAQPTSRPSTTDQRVMAALNLGAELYEAEQNGATQSPFAIFNQNTQAAIEGTCT